MKKTLSILLSLTFLGAFAQGYHENFDTIPAGDYIAATSNQWITWDGSNGGSTDAKIDTTNANSGKNSLKFSSTAANGGPQDVVLNFDQVMTNGSLTFDFNLFVANGKGAYFNFQGHKKLGRTVGLSFTIDSNGDLEVLEGSNKKVATTNLALGKWTNIRFDIDFNRNVWEFFIDNNLTATFQNSVNKLSSVDYYPILDNEYWIDDVSFNYTPYVPVQFNAAVEYVDLGPLNLENTDKKVKANIKNLGIDPITSFDAELDYNGIKEKVNVTLTGSIAIYETHEVEFSAITILPTVKTLSVTISNINGKANDDVASDDVQIVDFNVVSPAPGKVVFVEEGTGTWCQWCPRGAVTMEHMKETYPGLFAGVAVHSGDPMERTDYAQFLAFAGLPGAKLNRGPEFDPGTIESMFEEAITTPTIATLKLGSEFVAHEGNLYVSISTTFTENESGDWRVACIITEDEINRDSADYDQSNAYAGGGNGPMGGYENLPGIIPAKDMIYHDVVRRILPSAEGLENSFPTTIEKGTTYDNHFAFKINNNWNLEHFNVVGILIKPDGTIENSNFATKQQSDINGYIAAVSVEDMEKSSEISIFPNPFNENVTIRNNEIGRTLDIVNALGQTILTEQISPNVVQKIATSELVDGVYLLNIKGEDGKIISTETVVKY